jgi:hypothetical protein
VFQKAGNWLKLSFRGTLSAFIRAGAHTVIGTSSIAVTVNVPVDAQRRDAVYSKVRKLAGNCVSGCGKLAETQFPATMRLQNTTHFITLVLDETPHAPFFQALPIYRLKRSERSRLKDPSNQSNARGNQAAKFGLVWFVCIGLDRPI